MTSPMHDRPEPDPRTNGHPDPEWSERFYEGITEYERVRARRLRLVLCLLVITAGIAALVVLA